MNFRLFDDLENGGLIDVSEILERITSPQIATQGLFELLTYLNDYVYDCTWEQVSPVLEVEKFRHRKTIFLACLTTIGIDVNDQTAIEKILRLIDMRYEPFDNLKDTVIALPDQTFIHKWEKLVTELVLDRYEETTRELRKFLTVGYNKEDFLVSVTSPYNVLNYHNKRNKIVDIYGPSGLNWLSEEDCEIVLAGFDINNFLSQTREPQWQQMQLNEDMKRFHAHQMLYKHMLNHYRFLTPDEMDKRTVLSERDLEARILDFKKEILDLGPTITDMLPHLELLIPKYSSQKPYQSEVEELKEKLELITANIQKHITSWSLYNTDIVDLRMQCELLWSEIMQPLINIFISVLQDFNYEYSFEKRGNASGHMTNTTNAVSKIIDDLSQLSPVEGYSRSLNNLAGVFGKSGLPGTYVFVDKDLPKYVQAISSLGSVVSNWMGQFSKVGDLMIDPIRLLLAYQAVGPLMPKVADPEA